jgi:hypothetical protein
MKVLNKRALINLGRIKLVHMTTWGGRNDCHKDIC